jgi:glycosyltransferase involved in cell wall biosynthesis
VRVLVHAPGPAGHGVVRHAAAVARAAGAHGVETVSTGPDLTHAQFTDALYGPDIAASATAFAAWAATAPRPLVVTLHDVPGADADPARDAARGRGYARVVAACDGAVVSAEHEAAKIERLTGRRPAVVPLPVTPAACPGPRPAWADRPTLGVLGWIYPGKGHDIVVDAAARRPDRPRVVAAGSASPGHAGLVDALARRAAARGVELVVTGPLDEADMAAAAAAVTVPIAPGAGVSASGSLATWLGCDRRPLAARGEYATELAARHPGVLDLYAGGAGLDTAVAAALADPERTRLRSPVRWPDAGAAHAALYARLAGARGC